MILRRYDNVHQTYNSWYRLPEPMPATATVGLSTGKGVALRYERNGPRQCARFYINVNAVPEAERTTRIVKVAERKLPAGEDDDDPEPRYETKMATTVPEAAFEAMLQGRSVPGDVVARLNQCITTGGVKCAEAQELWAALEGKSEVCLFFENRSSRSP